MGARFSNEALHTLGTRNRLRTGLHSPIKISHRPCGTAVIVPVAGNQVEMQMTCTFTKGNRVHPVTVANRLHQLGSLLNNQSPLPRLCRREVDGATEMTPRIKQTPTHQRRGLGVVTKQPAITAPKFVFSQVAEIAVQRTNRARGIA